MTALIRLPLRIDADGLSISVNELPFAGVGESGCGHMA